jgi:S1-C subfamily serine protease
MRATAGGGRAPELVGVEFKEVKLRLADGKEVPARFVLKDADLDLAFMAPDVAGDAPKPEFPLYVKLDDSTEGTVMGTYFGIDRAPKVLQRVPLVRTSSIIGVVEKPRKFYLMTAYALGTPTFDHDGHALGVTLQNFASGRRTGFVVLPAADIAEIAKQAAAIQLRPKPPEPAAPAADAPVKTETTAPATP